MPDMQGLKGAANLIKLELILFFRENPGAIDTADGIAARLCRSSELIREALEDMVESGVICLQSKDGCDVFAYGSTVRLMERLHEMLPDCHPNTRERLAVMLLKR
ncbi:MAG: hypothetical protein ACYC55_07510 [Candidatus Geothermincolia bacterium]